MTPSPRPILRDIPEEIHATRIVLRAIRTGDGAEISETIEESREHLAPWSGWLRLNNGVDDSEEYARHSHASWIKREGFRYGIRERETGMLLGQCNLIRPDWNVPSIEIGYWIRASAEGRGYVTEAVQALIRLCFEELGMQRVHIRCDSLNRRSAAVAERAGFLLEATLRNQGRGVDGTLRDECVYGMTDDDYRQAHPSL